MIASTTTTVAPSVTDTVLHGSSLPNAKQTEVSRLAETWSKEISGQPGYRKGHIAAPGQQMVVMEVSSFMQVPAVLEAIARLDTQTGTSAMVRLQFPAPDETSQNRDAIIKEQCAVRNFLATHTGRPLAEISEALASEIDKSASFKAFKEKSQCHSGLCGASWVASLASTISSEKSVKLCSSTVYNADHALQKNQDELNQLLIKLEDATGQVASTSQQTSAHTISVSPENADALAASLRKHLDKGTPSRSSLKGATIVVGPAKNTLTGGTIAEEDITAMCSLSVEDFLKRYQGKSSEIETPTPTQKQQGKAIEETGPALVDQELKSLVELREKYSKALRNLPEVPYFVVA
jgi:hypothetical protein